MKSSVTVILAAAIAVFSGWAVAQQQVAEVRTLRGADTAATDQAPDEKRYTGKKPGLQKPIPRTFKGQPPLIPHAVDNFDEITLEENQCLSCHGPEKYKEKKAPRIGDSHFLDRDGKKLSSASTVRHNCVQCHVAQTDAPPLVDNTFVGHLPRPAR